MKPKKKFSETKVGGFLKKIAPHLFDVALSLNPTSNILKAVKGLITDDKQLTPQDKETALILLKMDASRNARGF